MTNASRQLPRRRVGQSVRLGFLTKTASYILRMFTIERSDSSTMDSAHRRQTLRDRWIRRYADVSTAFPLFFEVLGPCIAPYLLASAAALR